MCVNFTNENGGHKNITGGENNILTACKKAQ